VTLGVDRVPSGGQRDGMNLAARICSHAQAGQILVSDVVRQLAAGRQFLFTDVGETVLPGFRDPVKLWELNWESS